MNNPYTVDNTFFVHNCFGSCFRGILDWFGDKFYTRFNYKVIGTYDKAVEFFNKKKQIGTEVNAPLLPSITLDPGLDFSPEDRGGRFLWQYSNYAPGQGYKLWNSIDLKEQEMTITPCFTRYQGTFEVIFWMSSVYELLDFRTMLLQYMGGYNRYVRPEFFWTYLILPDKVINYKTDNVTPIDWGNTASTIIHVESINKRKRAIPFPLDPIWKLESLNDNSAKYGQDQIAEYKLSGTFNYEINIPTFVVLDPNIMRDCLFSFSLGKTITEYPLLKPKRILEEAAKIDPEMNLIYQKSLKFYRINPEKQDAAIKICDFSKDTLIYPQSDMPIYWCPIYSGPMKFLTLSTINQIEKGDIVVIDSYRDEYLSAIRRAACVISKHGRYDTMLYEKCELLKKGLITDIKDDYDLLLNYNGRDVTVDVLNRRVYLEKLDIEEDTSTGAGLDQSRRLKETNPVLYNAAIERVPALERKIPENTFFEYVSELTNRAIVHDADGLTTTFPIRYSLDHENLETVRIIVNEEKYTYQSDYTYSTDRKYITFTTPPEKGSKIYLGVELVPIRDIELCMVYTFTASDENNRSDIYIEIDFPVEFYHVYEMILVSYCGKLNYYTDYEIDFVNKKIIIKLKPKQEEIIQFFSVLIN